MDFKSPSGNIGLLSDLKAETFLLSETEEDLHSLM